jgi:hypothetical protein
LGYILGDFFTNASGRPAVERSVVDIFGARNRPNIRASVTRFDEISLLGKKLFLKICTKVTYFKTSILLQNFVNFAVYLENEYFFRIGQNFAISFRNCLVTLTRTNVCDDVIKR